VRQKRGLWAMIVLLIVAIALAAALPKWLQRENTRYRRAFAEVRLGMTAKEVEARFGQLKPRSISMSPRDPRDDRVGRSLLVHGPNGWRYRVFFDEDSRVIDKVKWWD